jgi:hypothetical protein
MIRCIAFIITLLLLQTQAVSQRDSSSSKRCLPSSDVYKGQPVYRFTDKMPVFQNGSADFMKYISDNFVYPEGLKEFPTRSTFQIAFIIDTLGKVQQVCCITDKDYYEPAEEQLIGLLEKSPAWIPASMNGKKVCVRLRIPLSIHFK